MLTAYHGVKIIINIIDKTCLKKYLSLLEIEDSEPSFELLSRIVKAHLIKVPFENISKLLLKQARMNRIPELAEFLQGIEKYNFGGTCYANNYCLYLLLKHLGFDVTLCGADMKNPDVHLISRVKIEGREYIVDGGYAAPFLIPLPIDLSTDYIITLGNEKYFVKPKDEKGRTRVEQHYNGKLQNWYIANSKPRKIEDFSKVIAESYADDAVFMNAVRITRFTENGALVLKNFLFAETNGAETTTLKLTREELPDFIELKFQMPAELVRRALESIKELKDIYN